MKVKLALLFFVFAGNLAANAQKLISTSGGSASGSGGTVAYTIGQMAYTTQQSPRGQMAQGIQQAYEVLVISGLSNSLDALPITVYPIPSAHLIYLQVGKASPAVLHYHLYDSSGKLVLEKRVENSTESINMAHLAEGSYFLKLSNNNREERIFKIIKN